MNPFDDSLAESDELPPMEVVAGAPPALPRLSIVHLFMWTAATALAMLPFQLFMSAQKRSESPSLKVLESTPMTAASTVNGVAAGAYLVVAVAAVYWRRHGLLDRYQPGHWLAFAETGDWLASTSWMLAYAHSAGQNWQLLRWMMLTRFLMGIVLFLCFVWLAWRSRDGARWRLTFLLIALLPAFEVVWTTLIAFLMRPTTILTATKAVRAVALGGFALVLGFAMTGDRRRLEERHWSHWMASGAFLLTLLADAAIYAWYSIYPELMRVR